MKWGELLKIATEKGYIFLRHGKKHDIYEHPDTRRRIIVEGHQGQEIRTSLLRRLKKELDLEKS